MRAVMSRLGAWQCRSWDRGRSGLASQPTAKEDRRKSRLVNAARPRGAEASVRCRAPPLVLHATTHTRLYTAESQPVPTPQKTRSPPSRRSRNVACTTSSLRKPACEISGCDHAASRSLKL
eukprot:365313-Chlamydomonas_euryale.AAC.25